jgi:GAF domain-containing protein
VIHSPQRISYSDKQEFYRELCAEIESLLETTWFTNLANVSATLSTHLPDINWVGFYLNCGNRLQLGPFQGLPACLQIPFGKGVCGTVALQQHSLIIPDVEKFPGHIACDARSRSELAVPLILPTSSRNASDSRLLGVLDVDSPLTDRFCEKDREGLEKLLASLIIKTQWPVSFV